MNAMNPKPSPAFMIQTSSPTEALRSAVDPVIPAKGADSLGFDAALPRSAEVAYSSVTEAWEVVAARWRANIAAEQLADVQIHHYRTATESAPAGLTVRPTDGAIVRKTGSAVAYTEHAWAQLINLLLQEVPNKPRGAAEPLRWLSPAIRTLAFADVRNRSRRREGANHPVILRSFVEPRSGVRALRAVLSGRHSGTHFDDLNLSRVLERVIPSDAPAFVSRAHNLTRGYVVLDSIDDEARATLSWQNSETGCASLSFSGGVYITALDALIVSGKKVTTEADLGVARMAQTTVAVVSSGKATRRAHTLPRKDRSEAERAEIASKRIRADVDAARDDSAEIVDAWRQSKTDFAPGYSATLRTMDRKVDAAVLLDVIEERSTGALKAEDRALLERILGDSDRLAALPYMSAALVAGAWAVAAREQTNWEEADRMMGEARRWIVRGFKR